MSDNAIPFPVQQPPGYNWLEDEPEFEPSLHLDLQMPTSVVRLSDLGYSETEIASKASTVAATSAFRILSDEGSRVMLDVARSLKNHAVGCERIENMVRGGCYRSRFLRDLCIDPSGITTHCHWIS